MLLNLLALSAAVLLNSRTVAAAQSGGTPCSSVSSMSSAFVSLFPSATRAVVPAQAAEDCLKSIPIDKDEDLALMDEMMLYIHWQTTLAYLRNPPAGAEDRRVDIIEELNRIRTDLENDKYDDEYTLLTDISASLKKAHDFHLVFNADIESIFIFRRGNIGRTLKDEFALVSVSSDGKELPKLYNYYDIINSEKTASPIVQINNQSAEDYVQKFSLRSEYLEDHARYNRLFPNQNQMSYGAPVNFFGRANIPEGDYTYVTHANKSSRKYFNNAYIALDQLDGVEDGEALAARFLNKGGPPETTEEVKRAVATATAVPTATGFPRPEILHSEGLIGGYFLSGNGYDDVAVLSVPSFHPSTETGPVEFQDVIGYFLKNATSKGKKKLVIDLRGNGGGRLWLGFDLFKQLFPSDEPYAASCFRANEAFDVTGAWVTDFLANVTEEDAIREYNQKGTRSELVGAWASMFNYKIYLKPDGSNFTSWEEYYGPETRNGDNFTTLARRDLNNFFTDDITLDVTGYRTRANKLERKQPFEASNIVLLQDGGCGSTCASFTELMKTQGGVQQIVVGGLPKKGPMQGVAGSKGSQVLTLDQVQDLAAQAYDAMPQHQEELNQTEFGQLVFANRPLKRSYWSGSQAASSVNVRDNFRMNDTSKTPLEFVYEAANCRLFYTPDMVRDVTNVWKKTVDARWGDSNSLCVEGSMNDPSSAVGSVKAKASSANSNSNTSTDKKEGSAAPKVARNTALMALAIGVLCML